MAFLDNEGLAYFWQQILARLNKFVPAENGKGLSTNDFTNEEKGKLAGIAEGAEQNVQSDWSVGDANSDAFIKNKPATLPADGGNSDTVNGYTVETNVPANAIFTDTVYTHPNYEAKSSDLYKITVDDTGHVFATSNVTKNDITNLGIPAQDTTYGEATTTSAGLMSASDKSRLDGLVASGGEANQNAFSNVIVGDKIITADTATDMVTLTAGNNITLIPDEANNGITITAKDTTYSAAGANLGLVKTGGDAVIADGIITITILDSKVDKVDGKGLSTNDYTTAEKTKLAGIAESANKVELSTTNGNIKINGTEAAVYIHPSEHAITEVTGLQDVLAQKSQVQIITWEADD